MSKKKNGSSDQPTESPSDTNGNGDKRTPVQRFYYPVHGGTLSVSVWDKVISTQEGQRTVYSVTVQRSYQGEEKREWTHSLRDSDLPAAMIGMQDAYKHILTLRQPKDDVPL